MEIIDERLPFQFISARRIEDAASTLQRDVEEYCREKESKGMAIRGSFRMFAHFPDLRTNSVGINGIRIALNYEHDQNC